MDPVIVVGGGIAGIAAARRLSAASIPTVVYDRGHRLGGRMAVKTTDGRPVDTGASYFTVSDPDFEEVVEDWRVRGLARPWTDTLHVLENGEMSTKSGPTRWAAPGGLRSLVEDMAADLDIEHRRDISPGAVRRAKDKLVVDGATAAAVVLAMPDPQARKLLDASFEDEIAQLDDDYEPVLAVTAWWAHTAWTAFDAAFVNGSEVLSFIADDGRRRGDDAPVLVAHSTPGFAAPRLDDPPAATGAMVDELRRLLAIDTAPEAARVNRWSVARPSGTKSAPFYLGDALVGLCGDSWSEKPRVESAYLSGRLLGDALVERFARG